MKKLLFVGLALITAFMAYGAMAAQDTATLAVKNDPKLGMILTDPDGRTLYLFKKDEKDDSYCYDKCAQNWPPYAPKEPLTLPAGVEGSLKLIDRDDGTKMLSYNGMPLYYFIKDTKPGDTNGEGVGDVWFVVHPGQMFGTPFASPVASPVASPMATIGY